MCLLEKYFCKETWNDGLDDDWPSPTLILSVEARSDSIIGIEHFFGTIMKEMS